MTKISLLVTCSLVAACGGGGDDAPVDATPSIDAGDDDDDDAALPDAALPDAALPDAAAPDAAPLPIVTETMLSAGFAHTCLLRPTGQVKCWGSNGLGQLGLGDGATRGDGPGDMGASLPVVDLGAGRYAVAVTGGINHTCAILDDGQVKCWGQNDQGQLGLGDTETRGDGPGEMGDALPAVDLGAGRTAVAIVGGSSHTCALLDNQEVKCWGGATHGELGQGDVVTRGDEPGEMGDALPPLDISRPVAAIGVGSYFSCAMSTEGDVGCWGSNSEGQLGIGSTAVRGDGPDEMGDSMLPALFGTGRHAVTLGVGEFASCVILDDASLKCFGAGQSGQLGLGDTGNRGDGPSEMGDNLPVVELGTGRTAQALAFTQSDTCALLDDSTVKCWGYNFYGQSGQGHTQHLGDGAGEMGDALLAVPMPADRAILQIAGGGEHICALFEDGGVRCWGFGGYGQLGQGNTDSLGDNPGELDALEDLALGF